MTIRQQLTHKIVEAAKGKISENEAIEMAGQVNFVQCYELTLTEIAKKLAEEELQCREALENCTD